MFPQTPLETIYSVGEGRTVVVALDGCQACIDAFGEFIRDKQQQEDRIVALIDAGRVKLDKNSGK